MPNSPTTTPDAPVEHRWQNGDALEAEIRRLRVAVIGCGSIGWRHAANLAAIGVEQISVYDEDRQRAESAGRECGARSVSQFSSLLDESLDAAVIATPTQTHVELALELAGSGCHLLIEKPLSHSLDQVEQLCREVERRRLVAMVACNMRFHPGPATVHEWLEDGAIGRVLSGRIQTGSYLPSWRPGQTYRSSYSAHPVWGGAILDCIHEIDLATWYLGPAKLAGACWLPASSIGLETDGLAELILRHTSGAVSSVHLNFVQRDYRRCCQIIGEQGTIYWDESEGGARRMDAQGQIAEERSLPHGWTLNDIYADQMRHFLGCVVRGMETCNPLRNAAATLEIALAARERGRIQA